MDQQLSPEELERVQRIYASREKRQFVVFAGLAVRRARRLRDE